MEVMDGYNAEPTEAIKLALYIRKKYFDYEKNTNKRVISPIKLQKSLYFLFAYWGGFIKDNKDNYDSVEVDYSHYSEILFNDRIEAWTYGPVVPEVFTAEKLGLLDKDQGDNYLDDEIEKKEFIDDLLLQLFEIDDFGLVRISHEDECWRKNYVESDEKHNREITKDEIISEYTSRQTK